MAISNYKRLTADTLAAILGYSASVIPPPAPSGESFNVFNGLTQPETFDGIWLKTEEEIHNVVIEAQIPIGDWNYGNDMPEVSSYITGTACGTNIYMFGGGNATSKYKILNTTTGVWTLKSNLPNPGYKSGVASNQNHIYVIGDGWSTYATKVRILNDTTGVWSEGVSVPTPVEQSGVAIVENNIYVCGGKNYASTTRIFNLTTGVWSTGADMPNGSYDFMGTLSIGKYIYVTGGSNTNSIYRVLNTVTGVWTSKNNIPNSTTYATASNCGVNIYVIGGYGYYRDVRILDTQTGVWQVFPNSLPDNVRESGSASVGNKVYVCGGTEGSQKQTRILSIPSSLNKDNTVVILPKKANSTNLYGITKLNNSISICVENAWLVKEGKYLEHETYIGNSIEWIKLKDAI